MSDEFSVDYGAKFKSLTERQRRFAWWMGTAGALNATDAARKAGYSDPGGDNAAVRVRAHELMHNPKVRAAVEEVARVELKSLAPLAIAAAKGILEDPEHPSHGRMVEAVLDRTGFIAETRHSVHVEHRVDTRELEALARRLAAESGVSPERLLGSNAGPVIEGEVVKEERNGG